MGNCIPEDDSDTRRGRRIRPRALFNQRQSHLVSEALNLWQNLAFFCSLSQSFNILLLLYLLLLLSSHDGRFSSRRVSVLCNATLLLLLCINEDYSQTSLLSNMILSAHLKYRWALSAGSSRVEITTTLRDEESKQIINKLGTLSVKAARAVT